MNLENNSNPSLKTSDVVDKNPAIFMIGNGLLWFLFAGKRSVIYLKTNADEPIFELREITLGNRIGDNYEVIEGLNSGDEIVTNGTFTVDAAAQLQGKKSMMNRNVNEMMTGHEGHLGMENNGVKNENKTNLNTRIQVSKEFQNQLKTVFNSYINLKDALVKEDTKSGIIASEKVLENLAKVDMKLLKNNEVHTHWMVLEKRIKQSTSLISKTSNIKEQRNFFREVSSNLTNTIEIFGINEKVYHQFCPMANDNKGAYWLSKEEKVMNPYFGEAMLTCGEVKQIIE